MTVCLPKFWNYDADINDPEYILPDPELYNDTGCKLYTVDTFKTLCKREKNLTMKSYISRTLDLKPISKIYIISYIYYIIYTCNLNLDNTNFYNTCIFKLKEFIKDNNITYQHRRMFNDILYLLTGKYMCEFKQCSRHSCNKKNQFCSVHIRNINKYSKGLTHLTKLPLDISKIIYEYSI